MNTIIIFIGLTFCVAGCRKIEPIKTVAVTTISDNSDYHKLRPDIRIVWSLIDYPDNISQAASFRITSVTNLSLNEVVPIDLSSQVETDKHVYNKVPNYRKHLINAFYDSVNHAIDVANSVSDTFQELSNSEVYRIIVSELELLSKRKTDRSYLLVYSDLRERSGLWDSYENPNASPQDIASAMATQCSFPTDLDHVTVFLLFQPMTIEEDKSFRQMQEAYKILLTQGGAKVIVQSSNTLAEL